MTTMNTYAEKLRDPRWQRKRLEIMQRDNFACTMCDDSESTLNVHHWKYNGDPWEAENHDLSTVCETCHELIETRKKIGLPTRAGHGWRFLIAGEMIMEGDQWWCSGSGWMEFGQAIGALYKPAEWGHTPEYHRFPGARRRIQQD